MRTDPAFNDVCLAGHNMLSLAEDLVAGNRGFTGTPGSAFFFQPLIESLNVDHPGDSE
jgi:hypothetical protein